MDELKNTQAQIYSIEPYISEKKKSKVAPNKENKTSYQPCVLVVEDCSLYQDALKMHLEGEGMTVIQAHTGDEGLLRLKEYKYAVCAVILDYQIPGINGQRLIKAMLEIQPEQGIILHSGRDDKDTIKETLIAGASDYIEKSDGVEKLTAAIRRLEKSFIENRKVAAINENKSSKEALKLKELGISGNSEWTKGLISKLKKLSKSNADILLVGETGTGKEVIAKAISKLSKKSLFPVNLSAISESSSASARVSLFGSVKGAFTGAENSKGVFEKASMSGSGTVFLDELCAYSEEIQRSLLRIIEERKVNKIGSSTETELNFRVIGTAKPNIKERIETKDFLPDLYYRINTLTLSIPPLRERPKDIQDLAISFLKKANKKNSKDMKFSESLLKHFETLKWPGNIRQLKNVIERINVLSEEELVTIYNLPPSVEKELYSLSATVTPSKEVLQTKKIILHKDLKKRNKQSIRENIYNALVSSESTRAAAKKLGTTEGYLRKVKKELAL